MHAKRPFTAEEIAAIRARYPTEGTQTLAQEFHRTRKDIAQKASTLGVHRRKTDAPRRGRTWSDEENAFIRSEWPRVTRREITAQSVADRLRVTLNEVRSQAARLGLRRFRQAVPDWTEEENEILATFSYLDAPGIQRKLKKQGFHRSETAIFTHRYRLGCGARLHSEAYSAQALAEMLGIAPVSVRRWIRMGWLKASPRGDSRTAIGGPGDQWLITPRAARQFLMAYTAHVDFSRADKFWLVDLLAGGDYGKSSAAQHQDTCGHGDGSGFDEQRVAV